MSKHRPAIHWLPPEFFLSPHAGEVAQGAAVSLSEGITLGEGLAVRVEAEASGAVRLRLALADLELEASQLPPHEFERPDAGGAELELRLQPDGQRRPVADLSTRLEPGASQRVLWARLSLVD